MSEIADFLRARIAERRALALAASHDSEGRWTQEDPDRYPGRIVDDSGDLVTLDVSAPTDEQAAHIAANDPAAVIADLDLKLALVDLHDGRHRCPTYDQYPGGPRFVDPAPRIQTEPCSTLRVLAQAFAGHPDYKGEEWAP